MAAALRRRRALKYQAEGHHTEAQWQALKAHYRYTCLCCRRREPEITLTRDHVVPLTKGGSDWIENIQPLCFTCNSSKNDKTIDYRPRWWADHPGDEPFNPERGPTLRERRAVYAYWR